MEQVRIELEELRDAYTHQSGEGVSENCTSGLREGSADGVVIQHRARSQACYHHRGMPFLYPGRGVVQSSDQAQAGYYRDERECPLYQYGRFFLQALAIAQPVRYGSWEAVEG